MNETIASFPSTTLYSSDLISASAVAKRRLVDLPGIIDPESDDAQDILSPTVVFFDTAGCEMYERLEGTDLKGANGTTVASDGSRFNENEAEVVAKWVRQLVSFQSIFDSIGTMWVPNSVDPIPDRPGCTSLRNRSHHALPSPSGSHSWSVTRGLS